MKKLLLCALVAGAFVFGTAGAAGATTVAPTDIAGWKSGNAEAECAAIGDFQYAYKFDEKKDASGATYFDLAADASFDDGHVNHLALTALDAKGGSVSFSASAPIGAVIVKGGTHANVYGYAPQASADSALTTALNVKSGKAYGVSHITFCWNPQPEVPDTAPAWGDGTRYVELDWAMFSKPRYCGCTTSQAIDLIAAETIDVGDITVTKHYPRNAPAYMTVHIVLADGYVFSPDDAVNLSIQSYKTTPEGTAPVVDDFETQVHIDGAEATLTVPHASYYGIYAVIAGNFD
ncbi:hypothetical protein [Demequina iriomotensis]|uniref:hypothetical protein n=1 Tax=Demequina iriomotensis TaxID=1536641 RepID=UPI000782B524|nr:hypothetical protein [Demequina iriomotensis]